MYIRTSRPKTPILYGNDEVFTVGGSKVLRQSNADVATVVGAGVTLFEALKAHDLLMCRLGAGTVKDQRQLVGEELRHVRVEQLGRPLPDAAPTGRADGHRSAGRWEASPTTSSAL